MFLDQKDLKSNFLQKKNKQKKKIQENQQQNNLTLLVQKNIRSFISRNQLEKQALLQKNILKLIFIKKSIQDFQYQQVQAIIEQLLAKINNDSEMEIQNQPKTNYKFYLKKIFFNALKCQRNKAMTNLAYKILESLIKTKNYQFLQQILKSGEFAKTVNNFLLSKLKGVRLFNLTAQLLNKLNLLQQIDKKALYNLIVHEYSNKKMQEQDAHNESFNLQTLVVIFNHFYQSHFSPQVKFNDFGPVGQVLGRFLKNSSGFLTYKIAIEPSLAFLIQILVRSIQAQHKSLLQGICLQYNNILVLMQDEQDIQYFQNKVMNHPKMQQFSQIVLKIMQQIFESQMIVKIFFDRHREQSKIIKQVMIKSIKMLGRMFQDRKIIFLRTLLSSNQLLMELYEKKNNQFYQGLKMRLLPMDDEEFKGFNLFNEKQWSNIIHEGINKSLQIIKKQLKVNQNTNKKQLVPFQSKNQDNLVLSGISQTLQSFYKKSLRTKKINSQIFISKALTQAFYTFNFGTGALAMERLLKLYPFAFTFQSRLQKFKQLIKDDKKNHDRTLFLQQQVDDDLIIHVRRGKQFLDAFQALINKDLRRKYKLVFFNQQGLQQEGIDGGGLIKQFINRVLKSAFSEVYGLFYQTEQNQLMPNPYSASVQQYQFIGKIIGKAVYESITIQQKFVQPFLNLVIGRKNSFEDIQYIQPQVYRSLVEIKKMNEQDLQDMQQTFIILDQLPKSNVQKYVNLLNPSKQVIGNQQILVNRQNKLQFIMAYSDFKCNKQLQQKTRYFRKGFLKVMKPQWLTLFNNQQLNQIISGGQPNFDVNQLKNNCVYTDFNEKSLSVVYFWEILTEFTAQQKRQFLLFTTSCSRPPTLGFSSMKPKICISRDENVNHLPTANTCMNVFRLPDYKNKEMMRKKVLYAIYSKAGFEFA